MANVTFEWYGLSCVKMTVKQTVGEVTVLTDPIGADEGAKMPRGVEADIVLETSGDGDGAREKVGGKPFVISHAGEYESKGVFVYGVAVAPKEGERAGKDPLPTVYRVEIDDLSVAHLGCVGRPLSDQEFDRLSDVDVLILPVGGHGALSPADAAEAMTRIEPRVVIPVCFQTPGLKRDLEPVEKFLKEAGIAPERVDKLKLAKKDLPQDETKMYILSA